MAVPQIAKERLLVRGSFETTCNKISEWAAAPAETRETILRRMERSCFEVVINQCIADGVDRRFTDKTFVNRYSGKCYQVIANLEQGLTFRLLDGSVDPVNVGKMTSAELCPEACQSIRDEISRRENAKFENKVSRSYKCSRCGNSETKFIKFQARAADEDNTISVQCVHCPHRWRIN